MSVKELDEKFIEFLQKRSSDELHFIIRNELSDEEIIKILIKKEDEVKENILENF